MSQIIKNLASGPVPPAVPTSFVTQDGTGVPAANILIVNGASSTENNSNGVISKGGVVGTGTSNELDIVLTNRYQQTTTTVGAVTSTVTLLSALPTGTYTLDMSIAAFATAGGPAGNGYTIVGAVKSVAGVASLVGGAGAQQKDSFEDTVGANAVMGVSGNTITVTVTGVAGVSFDWIVTGTYTFIS